MTPPANRLIVAIDTADTDRAAALVKAVAPHCGLVKLGLEAFCAFGPAMLDQIRREGTASPPVFLDLKLHDIPNTIAGAVSALLPRRPAMLTIHAGGGAAMIAAARRSIDAGDAANRPILLAVTVLTSFSPDQLVATGVADGPEQQVRRLARLALDQGADGLVCGAAEVPMLRDLFGATPILVVPGIRPAGGDPGDQARIATPGAAIRAGASYIVVGRPITNAPDPASAAAAIAASIA